MTTRKRWPYVAEAARMESIAQARKGLRKLEPILEKESSVELLRNAAAVSNSLSQIITVLVEVRTAQS